MRTLTETHVQSTATGRRQNPQLLWPRNFWCEGRKVWMCHVCKVNLCAAISDELLIFTKKVQYFYMGVYVVVAVRQNLKTVVCRLQLKMFLEWVVAMHLKHGKHLLILNFNIFVFSFHTHPTLTHQVAALASQSLELNIIWGIIEMGKEHNCNSLWSTRLIMDKCVLKHKPCLFFIFH